jgi:hypothetical protein
MVNIVTVIYEICLILVEILFFTRITRLPGLKIVCWPTTNSIRTSPGRRGWKRLTEVEAFEHPWKCGRNVSCEESLEEGNRLQT